MKLRKLLSQANKYTFLILFCCSFSLFCQSNRIFKEDSSKKVLYHSYEPLKIIILGFETAGSFASIIDTVSLKFNRYSLIRWEPHLSYYPVKNIGIGLTGKIEHFQSNFLPDIRTLFEVGIYTRFFIPFKINNKYLKNISVSGELSISKANYYYFEESTNAIYNNNMNQMVIKVPVIISYKFFANLNFRYSYRYVNFLNQHSRFESSIGFEYHFIKNNI